MSENKNIYFIMRAEKDQFVLGMCIKNDGDNYCSNFYMNGKFDEVVYWWKEEPKDIDVHAVYSAIIRSMERYNLMTRTELHRHKNIYNLIFDRDIEIEEDY